MTDPAVDIFGNPDEEAIYQAALAVPLKQKIEKAIAMIREYEPMALQLSDEGYYVAFSGGKDSIVMERLFKMSGVKYQSYYNNVTIDPPELVWFIKKHYPEVKWNSIGKNLPMAMTDKEHPMPPTRRQRWCCEQYKERGGDGLFKAIGIRAEESTRRKGLWTTIKPDRNTGKPIICPILYWTETDIWGFIKQQNMPYCSLYDEGFRRLGCVGCPMGRSKQQREQFAIWPKYEQMWRRGFYALWKEYAHKKTRQGKDRAFLKFGTPKKHFEWWISGVAADDTDDPDCQLWLW